MTKNRTPLDSARRFVIVTGTTSYRDPAYTLNGLHKAIVAVRRIFEGTFGYTVVPDVGPDLTAEQLRDRLREFFHSPDRRDGDIVVIYYTGHGELVASDEYLLIFPETDPGDPAGTGVPPTDVKDWLFDRNDSDIHLMMILDACYAGAGAGDLVSAAMASFATGNHRGEKYRGNDLAVLATARPGQPAVAGLFAQAFHEATDPRDALRTVATSSQPYLPLGELVAAVNRSGKPHQRAHFLSTFEREPRFFPNPWYGETVEEHWARRRVVEGRLAADRELVWPNVRGALRDDNRDVWAFEGRHAVLAELSRWTRRLADDSVTRIVTGGPGSGKTSVLARFHALAAQPDRVYFKEAPPAQTLPEPGSVAQFVHARGRTTVEIADEILHATRLPHGDIDTLLASLPRITAPMLVVIDAVDESADPEEAVETLLGPLSEHARQGGLRLLIGTRGSACNVLARSSKVIDLDRPPYLDPAGLAQHTTSYLDVLRAANPDSPYVKADQPIRGAMVSAVAEKVAEKAAGSFLMAQLMVRALMRGEHVQDPYDENFLKGFPADAHAAMAADLDGHLGRHAEHARGLLLPLAYARGDGLPRGPFWARLATALTGQTSDDGHIDAMLRETPYYVSRSVIDGRPVFLPFHRVLAEHLQAGRNKEEDERTVTEVLRGTVVADKWGAADPYVRRYLAVHAAVGGCLDELVQDPAFVLTADRLQLRAALDVPTATATTAGRTAGNAVRAASARPDEQADEPERAAHLRLAAHLHGAHTLADRIGSRDRTSSWRPLWANWTAGPQLRTIKGYPEPVGMGCIRLDGTAHIVVASTHGLHLWGLATGRHVAEFSFDKKISAMWVGDLHGWPCAALGFFDRAVKVIDLTTRNTVGTPFQAGPRPKGPSAYVPELRPIPALTVATVEERDLGGEPRKRVLALVGGGDGLLRVHDLHTGRPVCAPLEGHTSAVMGIDVTTVDGKPVAVTVGEDGFLVVWDLRSAAPLARVETGLTPSSVAAVSLPTGPGAVVGCSRDELRVYDLTTGSEVRPLGRRLGRSGRTAVTHIDGRSVVCAAGDGGVLQLWDLLTGGERGVPLHAFTDQIGDQIMEVAVGWVEDRPLAVTAAQDGTLRVWDLRAAKRPAGPFAGHTRRVTGSEVLAIDDRVVLVTVAGDKTVRSWDLSTGAPFGPAVRLDDNVCTGLRAVRGARAPLVAVGDYDQNLQIIDVAKGKKIHRWGIRAEEQINAVDAAVIDGRQIAVIGGYHGRVQSWTVFDRLELGPAAQVDGRIIGVVLLKRDGSPAAVVATASAVYAVDLPTGRVDRLPAPGCDTGWRVTSLATLDGRPVAVEARDRSDGRPGCDVRVVDVWRRAPFGTQVTTDTPVTDAPVTGTWSRLSAVDGRPVLVLAVDGIGRRELRAWDVREGTPLPIPAAGDCIPDAVAFARLPDGPVAAVGALDGSLELWRLDDGTPVRGYLATGARSVVATATSTGRELVFTGHSDGTIRKWDAGSGRPAGTPLVISLAAVTELATACQAGRPVVVGCGFGEGGRCWDVDSGVPVGERFAADLDISDIARTALGIGDLDGATVVVTGRGDGHGIRAWNPATGRPVVDVIRGPHCLPVEDEDYEDRTRLAAMATGTLAGQAVVAAAGLRSSVVQVWDLATGRELAGIRAAHAVVSHLVLIPDGRGTRLYVVDAEDVFCWSLPPIGVNRRGRPRRIKPRRVARLKRREDVDAIAVHPNRGVAVVGNGVLELFTAGLTATEEIRLGLPITAMAFARGGDVIILAGEHGLLALELAPAARTPP
jgi:WD40 repeat protein